MGRKAVQPGRRELRAFHDSARDQLAHSVVLFSDEEVALIGDCLGRVVRDRGYTCWAAAVLPEHVHLLVRRHRDKAEDMMAAFQSASRGEMIAAGRRAPTHPVWGGPGWKVFLDTEEDVRRVVRYVRENPGKAGLPDQHWPWVVEYDGWAPPKWLRGR